MDEHKTPEEIINDNAAPDAPETDAPEACVQPEEGTAGSPAKPMLPKPPLRRRKSP